MSSRFSSRTEYEEEDDGEGLHTQESFELGFPSSVYDDFIANNEISNSPRDKLSFIDDKKQFKETNKFLRKNANLTKLTRILQTEIIRCKPENILDFINDEFFSLANQTRLRNILQED